MFVQTLICAIDFLQKTQIIITIIVHNHALNILHQLFLENRVINYHERIMKWSPNDVTKMSMKIFHGEYLFYNRFGRKYNCFDNLSADIKKY